MSDNIQLDERRKAAEQRLAEIADKKAELLTALDGVEKGRHYEGFGVCPTEKTDAAIADCGEKLVTALAAQSKYVPLEAKSAAAQRAEHKLPIWERAVESARKALVGFTTKNYEAAFNRAHLVQYANEQAVDDIMFRNYIKNERGESYGRDNLDSLLCASAADALKGRDEFAIPREPLPLAAFKSLRTVEAQSPERAVSGNLYQTAVELSGVVTDNPECTNINLLPSEKTKAVRGERREEIKKVAVNTQRVKTDEIAEIFRKEASKVKVEIVPDIGAKAKTRDRERTADRSATPVRTAKAEGEKA